MVGNNGASTRNFKQSRFAPDHLRQQWQYGFDFLTNCFRLVFADQSGVPSDELLEGATNNWVLGCRKRNRTPCSVFLMWLQAIRILPSSAANHEIRRSANRRQAGSAGSGEDRRSLRRERLSCTSSADRA